MEQKQCSKCSLTKPLSEFRKRAKNSDGFNGKCKDCDKFMDKHYYKRVDKSRKNANAILRRNSSRLFIKEYLESHPCIDCGDSDWWNLEFDHREMSDKSKDVNYLMQHASVDTIKKEIDKCDVRCLKCHRKRTIHQMGWWRVVAFQGVSP